MINKGILKVRDGKLLTKGEINEGYLRSYAIWNNYSRLTQSGVLEKTTMFGTTLSASNIVRFKEFINNNCNDYVLKKGIIEEILEKINSIVKDKNIKSTYTNYCSDNFYYRNQINLIKDLLSKNA